MFKKSLLAAATVAAFAASGAQAATVSATGITYSAEGSVAADYYTAPAVTVALGAEYQIGDTFTIEFSADFNKATTYTLPTLSVASSGSNSMTVGYLSKTDNSVTYRVTGVAGSTNGLVLSSASAFQLDDESVEAAGAAGVSVTYSAKTSTGVVIDSALTNTKKEIVLVKDEFKTTIGLATGVTGSAATDALDAKIDVANARLTFDGTGAAATDDALVIRNTTATGYSNPLSITKISYTLNGDFSWIVDTSATTAGVQSNVVSVTAASGTVSGLKVAADKITFDVSGSGNPTVLFETDKNYLTTATVAKNSTALVPGSFTVDAVVTHTAGGKAYTDTATGIAAGKWALNGATRTVNAYPISSAVQNFLWVANDGSVDGAISATAIHGGESYGPYELGTATAKSSVSVGAALDAALAADGVTGGRAEVTLTVNSPDANINVNASYKVSADADRLTLDVVGN